MIKIKYITENNRVCSCDNCNRITPLNFQYTFLDNKNKEYNEMILCKDCSKAVSNLFNKSIKYKKDFKYDKDEINIL